MGKRVKHGAMLIHQSIRILKQHKKLFVYPVLGAVLLTFVLALGIHEFTQHEHIHYPLTKAAWPIVIWFYIALLLFFYLMHIVLVFFDIAMIDSTRDYFAGKSPSVKKSLSIALQRLGFIVLWASFKSTVGVTLNLFQLKLRRVDRINRFLHNQFWTVTTYFTAPILLLHPTTPIKLVHASGTLITKHWGSPLIADFRFGTLIFIARLVALLPLLFAILIGGKDVIIIGIVITVSLRILILMIQVSSRAIICSALYWHITTGKTPDAFSSDILEQAFRPYKSESERETKDNE